MSSETILKHFRYTHLPKKYHDICAAMYSIADDCVANLPKCAERSAGLRKLLEARDCFMRTLDNNSGDER